MARPIYGISKNPLASCNCVPDVSPLVTLTLLKNILSSIRLTIERFYDPFMGVTRCIANMTMSATVPTVIYVRLVWVKLPTHTGVKFDKTNPIHLEDLKFIYNNLGKDWHQDPLASFMAAV